MAHDASKTRTLPSTGIPFWDMMLSFGAAPAAAVAATSAHAAKAAVGVEVLALGEETLHVGTRAVAGDTTRVRRVVVEVPVEQSVTLREERVVVERRKPTAAGLVDGSTPGLFTEVVVEMSDSFEVAEAWKSARVVEEVVLRREVTTRTETVRDTVRRDEIVLEQAGPGLPARREVAPKAKRDRTAPGVQQVTAPTPAQLAEDLQKLAERFDTAAPDTALETERALATLHETLPPVPDAPAAEHIPLDAPKAEKHRKG